MRNSGCCHLSGTKCTGISLLELSFAILIFGIGLLSLLSALFSAQVMNTMTAEYRLADKASQQQLEQARYVILDLLAQKKVEQIYDRQTGCGTVEHPRTFSVNGLQPVRPGEAVGTMFVIQDENSEWLGEPLDLNLDGELDSPKWDANYKIFPVRVAIAWRSKTGKYLCYAAGTVIAPRKL